MRSKIHVVRKPFPVFKSFDELFTKGLDQLVGSDFVSSALPPVNVVETDESFNLALVAPGFLKEDFKLTINKGELTIEAKVIEKKTNDNGKYNRREFKKQSFKRTFLLDQSINSDAILAAYTNGILKLTLPKKEEAKAINKEIKVL